MRFLIGPLLVIAFLFGAFTNPTTSDYASWARQEITRSQSNNPLLTLFAGVAAEPLIFSTTRRQNFGAFSIFTTRLDDTHEVKVAGLAGFFIPIPIPRATWRPGSPSPAFPHVIAASAPDSWKPEDGYAWVRQPPNGDFRVQWQPGHLSENFPHIVATTAEERWIPEDGYVWNIDPPPVGQLGVHWLAGRPSSKYPHVFAAPAEGRWFPETGYRWLTNPPPPGDLRVIPLVRTALALLTAPNAYRDAGSVGKSPHDKIMTVERAFLFKAVQPSDVARKQYEIDLACDRANPPCPRWWDYARRVSERLKLPLCPLDFQRDLLGTRYYATKHLPLTQACVVPGGLTSTGPLRCDRDGCCKPGVTC